MIGYYGSGLFFQSLRHLQIKVALLNYKQSLYVCILCISAQLHMQASGTRDFRGKNTFKFQLFISEVIFTLTIKIILNKTNQPIIILLSIY